MKRTNGRKELGRRIETWVMIVSGFLLTIAVGVTFAYIIASTTPMKNEFRPVKVTCAIEETFENDVKKDVRVKNTGDVNAFIRAMIVVNWVSDDGQGKIHAQMPKEGVDYSIQWGASGWKKCTDGFWYYNTAVAPGNITADLIETSAALGNAPEGYRLQIQILASAFQAMPETAIEQEWGVIVDDGTIVVN